MAQSSATQIKQAALEIANDILERAQLLNPELQQLKMRQLQIETQLESAQLCHQRALNFRPIVDGDLQCPSCWIRHAAERAMKPVGSEAENDLFRCSVCDQTIEIETGS